MVVTEPVTLDPKFVFDVSGIAYQVLELFESDKQVHLLYFKELKGMPDNYDLEVFQIYSGMSGNGCKNLIRSII